MLKFGSMTGGGGGGGGGAAKLINDGIFCANKFGSFNGAGGGPIFIEFVENAESKLKVNKIRNA